MFAVSLALFSSRFPPSNFGMSQSALSRYASRLQPQRSTAAANAVVGTKLAELPHSSASDNEDDALAAVFSMAGQQQQHEESVQSRKRDVPTPASSEHEPRRPETPSVLRPANETHDTRGGDASWVNHRRRALSGDDPSTVVVFNSTTQELHLNRLQRHALWEARCKEYQATLVSIVVTLQGHQSAEAKCSTLLLLHEERVIKRRLRLRADTYDDIFHLIAAVATSGEHRAHSQLTVPYLHDVWVVYRYMLDSGTAPTAKIVQFVMSVLELVRVKNVDVEARAHSLMLDLDARGICPSAFTFNSYVAICGVNNVMHIAMARLSDARTRHSVQPNASLCAMMLQGLLRNGQVPEAVRFIGTLGGVSMTEPLLNRILDTFRKAGDPLAVFTAYRAVQSSQLPITHVTVHILVQAMLDANDCSELPFVLRAMKRFRVKGDAKLLNRLLGLMRAEGLTAHHAALTRTMVASGVRVFDENRLTNQLPPTSDAVHVVQ